MLVLQRSWPNERDVVGVFSIAALAVVGICPRTGVGVVVGDWLIG